METKETAEKENAAKAGDAPIYEVIMQDEYDNLYQLGLYPSLEEATDDVNDWLKAYDDDGVVYLEKGDLAEYPSTFGYCFDREVEWKDDDACPGTIMVRGFALSAKAVRGAAARALKARKEESK